MARKTRIHYPGAVYHVILRGNAGQNVFREDQDYLRFNRLIGEGHNLYKHRIHAFCLMPNHVHLVIQVEETPLSKIMQNLSQRYTSWFNRKNAVSGHVFQGRYKANLIDADPYLLEVIRYIHLNPVRAGLTSFPEHYPWSSDRSYSADAKNPWLTTDWLLSLFSDNQRQARKYYKRFLYEEIGEPRRIEFHRGSANGRILGNERFLEASLEKVHRNISPTPDIEKMIQRICNQFKVKEKDLSNAGKNQRTAKARAMLGWLVRESGSLTLTELGKILKRDVSGLSRAATLLAKKADRDESLKTIMEKLKRDLLSR